MAEVHWYWTLLKELVDTGAAYTDLLGCGSLNSTKKKKQKQKQKMEAKRKGKRERDCMKR
jgi:hypothetical protein